MPAPRDGRSRPAAGTVPVGTEFDVRLQTSLSSETAKPEERFEATTMVDYPVDGPGSSCPTGIGRARIRELGERGRTVDRQGNITLSFDEIRIGDRRIVCAHRSPRP